MARDLTVSMLSAIAAGTVRPVLFYEGQYETGTVRLWTGVGPIAWNGQTWTGAGSLLSVSSIDEVSEVSAVGFSVSLTGLTSALLALNLSAARQGLPGRVWFGAFDAAGAVIADPFNSFSGRLDVPDIAEDGERATITVKYESRLIDLDKTRERRYTHEDQQIDYPGDQGFAFVASLQDKQIVWGKGRGVPVSAPAAPSGGGSSFEGVERGGWDVEHPGIDEVGGA